MVDLHVHSDKSDGSHTPTALVSLALDAGLTAMALTDHDTMAGVEEAAAAAKGSGLTVIPGIELSSHYDRKEIHIVGLYVNRNNDALQHYLTHFLESRLHRNEALCLRLQEAGYDITMEELKREFPDSVLTRAHFARLMHRKGYANSVAAAFERFLGDHCPYFIPREKLPAAEAVALIRNAGGIAVLAHPTLYHMGQETLFHMVSFLKDAGLNAIETKYTTYSFSEERQMKEIAQKLGLGKAGGSDFHGAAKPKVKLAKGYGNLYLDDSFLTELRKTCGMEDLPPQAPIAESGN